MFKGKLHQKLSSALLENGFEEPKELQLKSLPKINGGFDVIAVGPENSGKSTTIILSTIQKLKSAFEDAPRALILVKDQEAAEWMEQQFKLFAKHTDLRVVCAHEGGKIDKQSEDIYFGTDVVIAAPKRILEIYFRRNLNLNKIKLFVIDDAEMIIKHGHQGQIDRLGDSLPKCQHLIFTNNLDHRIEKLIEKFIVAPIVIEVVE